MVLVHLNCGVGFHAYPIIYNSKMNKRTDYHREYYQQKRRANDGRASQVTAQERRRTKFLQKFPCYFDLLQQMDERDRVVILGYYLEGRSLRYLGALFGVSRQQAQNLRDKALRRLQEKTHQNT